MLKDLLLRNRSYRRFEQEGRISEEELTELVGLTCLCASARNAQALKYVIVQTIRGKVCGGFSTAGLGGISERLGRT